MLALLSVAHAAHEAAAGDPAPATPLLVFDEIDAGHRRPHRTRRRRAPPRSRPGPADPLHNPSPAGGGARLAPLHDRQGHVGAAGEDDGHGARRRRRGRRAGPHARGGGGRRRRQPARPPAVEGRVTAGCFRGPFARWLSTLSPRALRARSRDWRVVAVNGAGKVEPGGGGGRHRTRRENLHSTTIPARDGEACRINHEEHGVIRQGFGAGAGGCRAVQVSRDTLGTKSPGLGAGARSTTGSTATRRSPHPPPLPAALYRADRQPKAAGAGLLAESP